MDGHYANEGEKAPRTSSYADLVLAERKSPAEALSGLNPVALVVSRDTAWCQEDRPISEGLAIGRICAEGTPAEGGQPPIAAQSRPTYSRDFKFRGL